MLLFCHSAYKPTKLPPDPPADTPPPRDAHLSSALARILLIPNSLHSGRAECLFVLPRRTNQREARAILQAGRGFSRGSGLGGSPASSPLFFRLEQFAADQILLKNFNASNIE